MSKLYELRVDPKGDKYVTVIGADLNTICECHGRLSIRLPAGIYKVIIRSSGEMTSSSDKKYLLELKDGTVLVQWDLDEPVRLTGILSSAWAYEHKAKDSLNH